MTHFRKIILTASITCFSIVAPNVAFASTNESLPSSSTVLANGLQVVHFGNITFYVPPAGFDPLTASQSQLAAYHIPLPPGDTSSPAYQQWTNMMSHSKQFLAPTSVISIDRSTVGVKATNNSSQPSGAPSSTLQTYYNWSGLESDITGYKGIIGQWNMPWAGDPQGDEPAYSSSWVGLGGVHQDILVQAGTESDILSGGAGQYYMWIEGFNTATGNGQQEEISNAGWKPQPGDQFYVKLTYFPASGSSSAYADFYMLDVTQNKTYDGSVTVSSGTNPESAEWITERTAEPDGSGKSEDPHLAGFGTIDWTECLVTKDQSNWFIPTYYGNYNADEMVTYDGKTDMADAGNISEASDGTGYFSNYFHNQGDVIDPIP